MNSAQAQKSSQEAVSLNAATSASYQKWWFGHPRLPQHLFSFGCPVHDAHAGTHDKFVFFPRLLQRGAEIRAQLSSELHLESKVSAMTCVSWEANFKHRERNGFVFIPWIKKAKNIEREKPLDYFY